MKIVPFFLFLLSIALALAFLAYTSEFSFQSFFAECNDPPSSDITSPSSDITMKESSKKAEFRLLLGVFSTAERYERRQLIRNSYWTQANDYSKFELDIKFIICSLTKEEDKVFVALEIMRFNDIIILDCVENGYKGKTYTYFSSLPAMFSDHPYDYAMKCDDDTYLRLGNLMESLRSKPREDVYFGLIIPCDKKRTDADYLTTTYMSGMGYLISWDLVEWIAATPEIKDLKDGTEDVQTGIWLNKWNKGKNRFHNKYLMYDYKGDDGDLCFRHPFSPETIAVHQLKANLHWARTVNYFKTTKGLKPSKLFHIP